MSKKGFLKDIFEGLVAINISAKCTFCGRYADTRPSPGKKNRRGAPKVYIESSGRCSLCEKIFLLKDNKDDMAS